MANIKYCRTVSTNAWYVFGFNYNEPNIPYFKRGIYCYNKSTVYRKRNKMYVIEASEDIKKLLFSIDESNVTVATSILNAELKKSEKVIIDY